MHIIVTHPNADFDAAASLLAAWRLNPEAVPVLPNSLNRNVRDFITLYENQLPFQRVNELNPEPITQVTIVDSQHLPSIKRLELEAVVHVIDHHELHRAIPPRATRQIAELGANVTQLIEAFYAVPPSLSPIEATLLLLGIYEDTGSLTYTNTTPRDLRAAAWLLAEGHAYLDIMREYLHYAMSEPQKALYEQLTNELETHTIHGHTIMIGLANPGHYIEEVSSVAHRLRDLYRPEALFILVAMRNHIQIVARSTNNAIDVGQITEYFGGGGHPRAAAGLVKDKEMRQLKQELLNLLRLEVKPATTVAQIMSNGVHTLTPDQTIRQATVMVERYGHEGFPVIDGQSKKVKGILSRREIDKAHRHQLDGAAISQFMTKGEFFVTPQDGVEAVQRLMVEQRIGQVPVVQPNSGQVIGIVTRTDLINLWGVPEQEVPSHPNLTSQLQQALSPALLALIQEAGELATGQGATLYVVGGFVRDLLLTYLLLDDEAAKAKSSPRFDLDLVVEGDAIAVAERLCARHGGRVYSHERFGTAKWMLAEAVPFNSDPTSNATLTSLDFVTARTEFYSHPTALPEIERSSIRQDLHRRDFTINTLALRLTPERFGELLDFYGGQEDLEARVIRVLHSLSFVEDPTRMLRAARLMARLDCTLEERTAELLANALDLLPRVSGERISHELELIFRENQPEKALQQIDTLDILTTIHPGLTVDAWLIGCMQSLQHGLADTPWADTSPDFIHYIGLLVFWLAGDEQTALVERLNLTTEQRTIIKQSHQLRSQQATIVAAKQTSTLYHLLAATHQAARLIVWLALRDESIAAQLVRFEQDLKGTTTLIDGHYLKTEFKLKPGPIYSQILSRLRDARLDGMVVTLEEERAVVEKILGSQPSE